MKTSIATFELASGEVHENVRITLQDRLQAETTARARGWDLGDVNWTPSVNSFLCWHAAKRRGLITCTYAEFIAGECVDFEVVNAEAIIGDPTQPEATPAL